MIHVSWCHPGTVDSMFCTGLMDICLTYPTLIKSHNAYLGTGLLSKSRNIAVKDFLDDTNQKYMLLLDADIYLSPENFNLLLKTAKKQKEPSIVSGVYFNGEWDFSTAEFTPRPVIFSPNENHEIEVYFDYPRNTETPIYAAGAGCLLMHRDALIKIREEFSEESGKDWCWFQDGPIGDNRWLSEDLMFFHRAQTVGVKVVANTSVVVPHHKDFWITEAHYVKHRSK